MLTTALTRDTGAGRGMTEGGNKWVRAGLVATITTTTCAASLTH